MTMREAAGFRWLTAVREYELKGVRLTQNELYRETNGKISMTINENTDAVVILTFETQHMTVDFPISLVHRKKVVRSI